MVLSNSFHNIKPLQQLGCSNGIPGVILDYYYQYVDSVYTAVLMDVASKLFLHGQLYAIRL